MEPETCKNCHHPLTTSFCTQCGQRTQPRFTFSYLVEELLELLTLDRGILHTFQVLNSRPAEALKAYLKGATKKYYPPIPYFLTAMTLLLVFGGLHQFLEADGWSSGKLFVFDETAGQKEIQRYFGREKAEYIAQLKLADSLYYSTWEEDVPEIWQTLSLEKEGEVLHPDFTYAKAVENLLEADQSEIRAYEELETKVLRSNLLIFSTYYLTPVVLSVIVFLFYFTKKLYFTEHLIAQTYLTAQIVWYVNLLFVLGYGVQQAVALVVQGFHFGQLSPLVLASSLGVLFLLLFAYYFSASRKFYEQAWWLVLIKTLFILPILLIVSAITFLVGVYFFAGGHI